MKILFLVVGKTDDKYILEGVDKYRNRLKHYIAFDYEEIPDLKHRKTLSELQQKKQESDLILGKLKAGDHIVLLDEKGKMFRSLEFANHLQQKMNFGKRKVHIHSTKKTKKGNNNNCSFAISLFLSFCFYIEYFT